MGLAREGAQLGIAGLPPNVIETILSARAASTRRRYNAAWQLFVRWCADKPGEVLPFQASVCLILTYLQEFLDRGLGLSSVKVNLAAISAYHLGVNNSPVSEHPLVRQFMKGVLHLRPTARSLVPPWDLTVVLDALVREPFEPLETVQLKFLSLKTALLVALTTAKRASDIHALSVNESCMRFSGNGTRVTVRPNLSFLPKTFPSGCDPVELVAFHPPPFASEEDRRLNCLCPVRALRLYKARTAPFRLGDQLFVAWAPQAQRKGKPVTKVRLSQWIVEAIQLAYASRGVELPAGLRAHSTRGMSASWALAKGVPIGDVCRAASWATPSTFAAYYNLDVAPTNLAHAVLDVAAHRAPAP